MMSSKSTAKDGKDGKRTGEVAELQKTLIRLSGQSGPLANPEKRETFRKVINAMTIGIDMSSLFTQMVLASSNDDLVLKKMLYQYIQTYSSHHTDNVLLTVNTLTKDCQDRDPKLRGLALRTLCSLRVANLLEYLVNPLKTGLEDVDPYVRRTAVMGIFKVHHLDESVVKNQGFVERLHSLLVIDRDSQVVANCLEVLVGIEGIQKMCTKETVYHLLNILKSFSEWAQCQVQWNSSASPLSEFPPARTE
jgi:vesicle coat complex subunit